MAGLLPSYGVMVGLAFALVMAPLAWAAVGAEQGHPGSDVGLDFAARNREKMDGCDLSNNAIITHTDGLKDTTPVLVSAETGRVAVPERQDDAHSGLQPKAEEVRRDFAMPRSEQADAPGPSPSGSTSIAVSGMMCVGVALLGLVMA
ncbi:hypothetical protein Taro_036776 [Colocasia esculenta]|uniref:Uncharacterized protein n=1 Tax=Colocasia esculenta TaxID=4460 RepID=A0A843W9D1_COLES|nr:hypothetical protein [Colocasia esculenta]